MRDGHFGRRVLWSALLCGSAAAACGQSSPGAAAAPAVSATARAGAAAAPAAFAHFEVASVRQSPVSAGNDGHWSRPGIGSFNAVHVPMRILLGLAFGVEPERIVGQPAWVETALYDIDARPEAGIGLTRAELKPRLEALLADRFHLRTHREVRSVDGFELVVAKGGPRLTPTSVKTFPGFRVDVHTGVLIGKNWTMPMLASNLTEPAGRIVVDRTGLAGSYDIALRYGGSPDADEAPLAAALRDTLGLELRRARVPVEVVVIDQLDRVPTEN